MLDQEPTEGEAPDQQASIGELCAQLIEDSKDFARAEIARVRAIIFRRIVKGRIAIFFMVASALLAQSAVLVLLLGLLMYLRIHVGIIGATAIVTVVALAASALFGWLAFRRIRHALSREDDLL